MKSRAGIRQPLLVYASLFVVVVTLVVGVISWVSLVTASRRAYRRAARRALESIAAHRTVDEVRAMVGGPHRVSELTLAVVTSSLPAFGLDLSEVRDEAVAPNIDRPFVSIPLDAPGREVYLVALFDTSVPTSIALVEVARMNPLVLLGALGCAGLMVVLVGRVLLPPLHALRQVAEETRALSDDALVAPAPNEILEVAQRFRRTVRQLNAEREVVEAQRDELARMQQNLVRASKLASVGRLAAGIAHEIGNPLAAVQGYLSLLRSGLPEAQAHDVLDRSRAELTRIHETIQKLLTYARTGEERPVEPGPFDVGAALREAASLAQGHPALRDVELRIDDRPLPAAHGHVGHFHQVIVNLLLNAGQAMVGSPQPVVDVRVDEDHDVLRVAVVDRGPGVPDDLKEVIFDPFYTTKAPGQGTGLGLAVSRALMETMGGDLVCQDGSGGGAAFVVIVPRSARLAG